MNNPKHQPGQPNPHLMNDNTVFFVHTPHSLISMIESIGYKEFTYTETFTKQKPDSTYTQGAELQASFKEVTEINRRDAKALVFYNGRKADLNKANGTRFIIWQNQIEEIAEYRVIDEGMRNDLVFSNFVITLKTGQQLIIYAHMIAYQWERERLYER